MHINAGPEIGVASTKAYTSQYVALVMIAVQLADDSILKTARRQQIIDGLHDIPGQIRQVLGMDKALQGMAKNMLAGEKSLLIMGRGYQCTSLWLAESFSLRATRDTGHGTKRSVHSGEVWGTWG